MKAPSAVSIRHMPAANRIGSESTARNGTWCVATPAASASSPTSVAVSKPSPNRTPSGYICQLDLDPAAKPADEEAVHEAAVEQPLPRAAPGRTLPAAHVAEDPDDVEQHEQVEDADDPEERPRDARADVAAVVLERRDLRVDRLRGDRQRRRRARRRSSSGRARRRSRRRASACRPARNFRVVLSIAAMWSASKAWRRPNV